MARIEFPNVPDVLGVPAIRRGVTSVAIRDTVTTILQGAIWDALKKNSGWGIFDIEGKPLVDVEYSVPIYSRQYGGGISTVSVDYSKETRVSDFPLELGSFASYNKVEMPATPSVVLCVSGNEEDRAKFINALESATKSTNLYTIMTPEVSYVNYTIERFNYQRRAESGATMVIAELMLKQIREVTSLYSESSQVQTPQNAESNPTKNTGQTQPEKPKASLLSRGVAAIKSWL